MRWLAATAAARLGRKGVASAFNVTDSGESCTLSHFSSNAYSCCTALSKWPFPVRSLAARTTPSRPVISEFGKRNAKATATSERARLDWIEWKPRWRFSWRSVYNAIYKILPQSWGRQVCCLDSLRICHYPWSLWPLKSKFGIFYPHVYFIYL